MPDEDGRFTRAEEIRAHYSAIVESSQDAIVSKNLEGVISAWNHAAQRMFGYSEQEAVGQPIALIIPPELHEEEHHTLRRLRAGERIDNYETVRVTKAGARIDVSLAPDTSAQWVSVNVGLIKKQESCRVCAG